MKKRPKNLPAKERQAVILESVNDLAEIKNPEEITTAAIVEHIDLTQGALFRHFPTKATTWQAVMAWVAERLLARIDRASRGIASSLEAMQAMFMAHIEFVMKHPGAPRMLLGELQRAKETPARQLATTLFQRYQERLLLHNEKGKANGELSSSLDNEAAAALFVGTNQGLVVQSPITDDLKRMRKDVPRVFSIFRRGIEVSP